jgi:hypothetical protein
VAKSPVERASSLAPSPEQIISIDIESPFEKVWKASKKLGPYALVKTEIAPGREIQVIVHAERYKAAVQEFLASRGAKDATLQLLTDWLKIHQGSLSKNSKVDFGSAPTVLLEDLVLRKTPGFPSNLGGVLLAQSILETFSRIESRVVTAGNGVFSLLIKMGKSKFFLFDPQTGLIDSSGSEKSGLRAVAVTSQSVTFGKDRRFGLFNSAGREIAFQVSGRTPTENRFIKEAALIASAGDDELVPFEIGFHPFWRRYGHTTLRIGESMYEFSSEGWRAHNTGADSARAYLFNNPFFKSRYSVFAPSGMPPISYGVSREAKASVVREMQKILDQKCAYQGPGREKFNLFLSNCNQKLRGVMRDLGIEGFEEKGFVDFSSVLSFNGLLNAPAEIDQKYWIYPLPNTDVTESNLRNWMPKVLYLKNTPNMERMRAIKSVLTDVGVGIAVLVNKLTYGVLRWKIWNGYDNYQHINDRW